MSTKRQATSTGAFLRAHPAFTFQQFADSLGERGASRARERLKYHTSKGNVKLLERGLYGTVPPGTDPERFQADRYLVAAALRPDGVFSHHAALELLGAAHSEWNVCTMLTAQRRRPLWLDRVEVKFLGHPAALRRRHEEGLGTRWVDRLGKRLRTTGPERTLVDGFHRPRWVGGLEELVESASGFGVLDLGLLESVLTTYGQKTLWAAAGWFLREYQDVFFVPEEYLRDLATRCPRSPAYLPRGHRGGTLIKEWNLVLPASVVRRGAPDAG